MNLTVSRSIGTQKSQKPSRSRRLTKRTRTWRRSNKETFTSAPEDEEKDTGRRWTREGENERATTKNERARMRLLRPQMNEASSDMVRGTLWRSRITRH